MSACRSVMRLIPHPGRISAGEIEFEGRDVLAMNARQMRAFRAQPCARILSRDRRSMAELRREYRQGAELRWTELMAVKEQRAGGLRSPRRGTA